MTERIPMTQEGYNRIKAEVERLEYDEMPKITERVANARAEGDLKENAEYHGARESQGMLQAKINQIKDKLSRATIIDPTKVPKDEVAFGATVTVKEVGDDDEETYTLVGAGDEDYDQDKILCNSPIGVALMGKKVGDHADVDIPKGTITFEIVKIEYHFD